MRKPWKQNSKKLSGETSFSTLGVVAVVVAVAFVVVVVVVAVAIVVVIVVCLFGTQSMKTMSRVAAEIWMLSLFCYPSISEWSKLVS